VNKLNSEQFDQKFKQASAKAALKALDPETVQAAKKKFIEEYNSSSKNGSTEIEIAFSAKIMKGYEDQLIYSLLKDLLVDQD